jgi:uncharacterized DUF497 family protein
MEITYDVVKNLRNVKERGLSFERAADMDLSTAAILVDDRKAYGEIRYVAINYIDGRLHVLCFTESENCIRIISLRKANTREAKRHGKPIATN